ncbi:MAG: ACT domain-containing protein, partial [Cyanobacteria bacterium J06628_3]
MGNPTACLLISCPDQQGLVAKIANFIYSNGGNIIHADQHTDFESGLFLTRIEWLLDNFNLPKELIAPAFNSIAQPLEAKWELHFSDRIPRLAIWVSKQDHCLLDLLWRHRAKEFVAEIPLII